MYAIELSNRVVKFLTKLDKKTRERIEERLKNLSAQPHPSDAKFIYRENNSMILRYRIGDYRALYKVNEDKKVILIAKIDKRERVYQ
ncbi:MAG: type II toxin-antitoxin system RelE/ParE family toxin [Nanoarchaeota archaeon]